MESYPEEITLQIDGNPDLLNLLLNHRETYFQLGQTVTNLILSRVSECDVTVIFQLFSNIQKLTLENVLLLNENGKEFPTTLQELIITDCRINQPLFESWLTGLSSSLTSLTIHRSYYALSVDLDGYHALANLLTKLPNVRYLSVEESCCRFVAKIPKVELFSYNVLNCDVEILEDLVHCADSLKTLVLRNPPKDVRILSRFPNLKNLRIISSVDEKLREKIVNLNCCEFMDIHYYSSNDVEENLLLKKLNNDCLIHICSFLPIDDWISFRESHPRFDLLDCTRRDVTITDPFVAKYPVDDHREIYEKLNQCSKSLLLVCKNWDQVLECFSDLKKLSLNCCFKSAKKENLLDVIPEGLEDLKLYSSRSPKCSPFVRSLLPRLATSLKSLHIFDLSEGEGLYELVNLRKLVANNFATKIDFEKELRNKDILELLEIIHFNPEDTKHLPSMKSLKVLNLFQLKSRPKLVPQDFPSLQELRISFNRKMSTADMDETLSSVLEFKNLKCLGLPVRNDEFFTGKLCQLKDLTTLECRNVIVAEDVLLRVLGNLPNLTRLETWNGHFSLRFDNELNDILKEQRRSLTMFSGVTLRSLQIN